MAFILQSFKKSLLIILIAAPLGNVWSQHMVRVERPMNRNDYPLVHYMLDNGKTDVSVMRLLEDNYGFIWFGTLNSLVCYNGYDYIVYRVENADPHGFKGCWISDIKEDRKGYLWVSTMAGINRLDRNTGTFTCFRPDTINANGPDNFIRSVYIDQGDYVWMLTNNNIFWLEPVSGKFHRIVLDSLAWMDRNPEYWWFGTRVDNRFAEDKEGNMWIATLHGLIRYNRKSDELIVFEHDKNNPNSISNDNITALYKDLHDSIWIATWGGGLDILTDERKGIFNCVYGEDSVKNGNASKFLHTIALDEGNKIWLGGENGICLFNTQTRQAIPYIFKDLQFTPYKIIIDKKKEIWLFGYGGLAAFDPKRKSLTFQNINRFMLVDAIMDRSGSIWIGTITDYAYRMNQQQQGVTSYKNITLSPWLYEDSRGTVWKGGEPLCKVIFDSLSPAITLKPFNFQDKLQTSDKMMEDTHQNLWFAGEVFRKYDPRTGHSKLYPLEPKIRNKVKKDSITFMLEDKDENLWFGAMYYLAFLNMKTGKSSLFYPDFIPLNKLDEYEINDIFIDHLNYLWIATARGLCRIYLPTGGQVRYLSIPLKKGTLSDNFPWRLHEDALGRLWVLCYASGLNLFNRSNETFSQVDPFKSSRNISFTDMVADTHGNLWILHSAGLTEFNPLDSSAHFFELPQILPYITMSMLKRGDVILSPMTEHGGTYRFHPENIEVNRYISRTWITKLLVNNVSLSNVLDLQKDFPLKKLLCKYRENFISFEFVSLNYTESEKNEYKYKMVGVDRDTVFSGTKRFANYPNLSPGTYTFWVSGSNNEGAWDPGGTSIIIQIKPPWYQTKLAFSGYLFFFVAAIVGFIRWRTFRLKKDKILLEDMVQERTQQIEDQKQEIEIQKEQIIEMDEFKSRFFTNISHEFRSPLTMIIGSTDDLLENRSGDEAIQGKIGLVKRNASRLLKLVNQLLDITKLNSSKMKLELAEMDVIDFIRTIAASFASLADVNNINFSYHIPVVTKISWCDPDKIEKVLVNLLSNAFKFTPGNEKITVEAGYCDPTEGMDDCLEFSVSDTGPGISLAEHERIFDRFYQAEEHFKAGKGGTGIGLSITRDLVSLMHGEIKLISEPGKGSTFSVKLPLGTSHLHQSEYVIIDTKTQAHEIDTSDFLNGEGSVISSHEYQKYKQDSDRPLILIIEDNKDIRMYLAENLHPGYRVMEAVDGASGLMQAQQAIPDLIVTDLIMPRMDGYELCRQLKTDERTSHIPVIMLTARVEMGDKLKGLATGADDYILKPFEMKELKTRISNLIEQRKKLREHFSRRLILDTKEIMITPVDEQFLNKAIAAVEKNIGDSDYGIKNFSHEMSMSRSTLARKLHALTDQSPLDFIRLLRIRRAAHLLKIKSGNVSEIAIEVGFNNPSYFAKCFKKTIGVYPHEYLKG